MYLVIPFIEPITADLTLMLIVSNIITYTKFILPKDFTLKSMFAELKYQISKAISVNQNNLKILVNNIELAPNDATTKSDCGVTYESKLTVWYVTYAEVIKHQNVLGFWTADVLETIGRSLEVVASSIPAAVADRLPALDDQLKLVSTVLALKCLKSEYSQSEAEWRLIFKKGVKYIHKQGFSFNSIAYLL